MRGQIVRLVHDRGFGFIRAERGQEIFFHARSVLTGDFDSLTEGQAVEFDVELDPSRGRNHAVNIRVAGEDRA